jgi:hypothetical protein
MPHGEAVAAGTAGAAALACRAGLSSTAERNRILRLLAAYQLPTTMPARLRDTVWQGLGDIRRIRNGHLHLIVPVRPGHCVVHEGLDRAAFDAALDDLDQRANGSAPRVGRPLSRAAGRVVAGRSGSRSMAPRFGPLRPLPSPRPVRRSCPAPACAASCAISMSRVTAPLGIGNGLTRRRGACCAGPVTPDSPATETRHSRPSGPLSSRRPPGGRWCPSSAIQSGGPTRLAAAGFDGSAAGCTCVASAANPRYE